ncbi:MAG: glycosyltransferase family 4 protein [Chitinophagaceae bacterium]|nr:glycosyltransferase family 4 protein [Chitinophagaceae bacterium]
MQNKEKRIFVVHLLNDYSGSPNVCKQVVNVLIKSNYKVTIITSSKKNNGFLSDIKDANYKIIPYKWSTNKFITLSRYLFSQIICFLYLIKEINKNEILYVNTILPLGALIAGKIRSARTICHIHEDLNKKNLAIKIQTKIIKLTSTEIIFVSNYVAKAMEFGVAKTNILYNCVSDDYFFEEINDNSKDKTDQFRVAMACSFKKYKGVVEFINLAKLIPEFKFHLILNTNHEELNYFKESIKFPSNIIIDVNVKQVKNLLKNADLILNLSIPKLFVETFGLSLIEGMALGKPVIAPPLGGPTEFVENGKNGFLIDSSDTEELRRKIIYLASDIEFYSYLSENAKKTAERFSTSNFKKGLLDILDN